MGRRGLGTEVDKEALYNHLLVLLALLEKPDYQSQSVMTPTLQWGQ